MAIGDSLQKYTFAYLMQAALAQVSGEVDKREGSIIYTATAPAAYNLALFYLEMYRGVQETYILTATGEWLDYRAAEFGIERTQATAAVKRGDFRDSNDLPIAVPIGSRWSTISTGVPIYYTVIQQYGNTPGAYELRCETLGTVGQQYTGNIVPLDFVPDVKTAILSTTLIPGQDSETDDELRQRYLDKVKSRPFGGNIAQYREELLAINGVGSVQVYPVWQGGGTVKVSILDSTYRAASSEFVSEVQQVIDPENGFQGTGLGLAPIDHLVTVSTATELTINVTAEITPSSGADIAQLQIPIEEAIEAYFASIRESWGVGSELNEYFASVYIAQVTAAMLNVPGVANASNVTLNGNATDVILVENSIEQQIPILGEVTISEST